MSFTRNAKRPRESISATLDELTAMIARGQYNELQDSQFEAVILTNMHTGAGNNQDVKIGKFKFYKIRALDGSDDGLLSPFTAPKKITENEFTFRVNRHRIAFYDTESEKNAGKLTPGPKQVWLCRYTKAKYKGPIVIDHFVRKFDQDPYIGDDNSIQNAINSGNSAILGRPPKPNTGAAWEFNYLLKWQEYALLSQGLTQILANIGRNESQKLGVPEYLDFNCGAPHSLDSCEDAVWQRFGMNDSWQVITPSETIVERSIQHIMNEQKNSKTQGVGSNTRGPAIQAAGRYKLVPNTIKSLVNLFNLDTTEKYSENWQDTAATYLLLSKRPLLGGYMVGLHDNAELAAHELAKEWSSYPSQYTIEEVIDGRTYDTVAGKSIYYLTGGGWHAKMTTHAAVLFVQEWKKEFQSFLDANPGAKAIVNGETQ